VESDLLPLFGKECERLQKETKINVKDFFMLYVASYTVLLFHVAAVEAKI
jgi:hypothetical protein